MLTRWWRWLDRQVEGLPIEERDRARAFIVTIWLALGISFISAALAAGSSLWALAALNVVNVVVCSVTLPAFIRTWSPTVVRGTLWGFLVTLSAGALATTPLELTNLGYITLIPLISSLMFRREERRWWVMRSLLFGGVTVVAGQLGVVCPEVDPMPTLTRLMNFSVSLVAVVALLNELARERERSMLRLQEAERAKSAFFANVGHELRTPMNGVLGMTDALLLHPLAGEQREMVEAIRSSGGLLLSLLDDLLDLSKLEAGRLVLEPQPVQLDRFLGQLKTLWVPLAERKRLSLQVELVQGVPSVVRLDPLRARQVLGNLISNALKFTEKGGVSVRVTVQGDRLSFAVNDTGIGIAPDHLARLFERFVQADDARARKYQGAGLGLALSRQLAEHMQGSLLVESVTGAGSRFTLEVPLVLAELQTSAPDGEQGLGRPLHVLVVDDNSVNQLVARRLLDRSGCTVEVAPDGPSALEAVARSRFDVVLMDVHMPGLDGLEATRRIRASERGPRLPIIAVSASAASEDVEQCRRAGMDDFLAKPLVHRRLIEALRSVTEASVPRS